MKLLSSFMAAILVLLLSSSPTIAETPDVEIAPEVIIFQVKTEGSSASSEYILLYNHSSESVNLMDWCVQYSSANDNIGFTECVGSEFIVAAGTFVSFGTSTFVSETNYALDFMMSGGMSSTGGHVRLLDKTGAEIDKVGWGSAINPEKMVSLIAPGKHAKEQALSRNLLSASLDTDDNFTDFSSSQLLYLCPGTDMLLSSEFYVDEGGMCVERFCPNLPESVDSAPDGYYKPEGKNECELIPVELEDAVIFITELYPNAPSTDTGNEFIELYNPNEFEVNLVGYNLQVGPSYTTQFVFPESTLEPKGYKIFSDSETGIVLPNSTGVQLRLVAQNGNLVDETTVYSNAQDDESWALVEDQWIYTNQITPNAANKPYLIAAVNEVEGVTSVLGPCPEGKFRNPATNRCKNIESAVSQLVPCDEDEFRNPETNRCNKISSSASSLTPCKPGQVRNPETNRCRSVASAGSDLKPCAEGQERNPETNRCRKVSVLGVSEDELSSFTDVPVENTEGQLNWPVISLAILGTAGYMVYEWRSEIARKLRFARAYR